MSEKDLCEKIQNEQGFIIFSHNAKAPTGKTVSDCRAVFGGLLLPPLRVIGYCTREDWLAQRAKYYSGESLDPRYVPTNRHYHKCILDPDE